MVEHGPGEEEGQIRVDVIPREELSHGGQHGRVVVDGQVRSQEVAELNEGVLTLVRSKKL